MGYLNIMPGYISQAMVAMLFCWLGWKSREKRLINKLFGFKLYNQVLIFILCATICFIASLKTDLIMMTNTYTAWWTMLISSVSGICMTMLFCGWISDTKIGNIFSYVGQRTLTILPLHMISFKLVNYAYMLVMDGDKSLIAAYPIITNRFPWWVLYSAVGLLIPLAIDWIKQKVEGGLV
jgi:fucose 4-O-acetylase-like acetyltransferase